MPGYNYEKKGERKCYLVEKGQTINREDNRMVVEIRYECTRCRNTQVSTYPLTLTTPDTVCA